MNRNEAFVELSAALTGFSRVDLLGTGVADLYWNTAKKHTSEAMAHQLLDAWQSVKNSPDSLETALRHEILNQPDLGPIAQDIIKMWYLGQWGDDASTTVSGEAYQQGLVWLAINAHTQGANQPGFGTWSFPPDYLEKNQDD